MSDLLKLLLLIFLSTSIISCGKNGVDADEELYLKAKEELDSKNYSRANKLFKKFVQKNPNRREYKQYWADSYLGMGGFELFDFLISIDRILSRSFESDNLLLEVKNFANKYFFIDEKRKEYLIVALQIYSEFDGKYKEKTREDKLKKGLVHILLLTQSLKSLIVKITNSTNKSYKSRELEKQYKQFVKKYLVHVDEMVFHGFRAYLNLKESFQEINNLLKELDRAIYDVFGIPYNKIRNELSDMNIERFIELFIKYNPKLYEEFMRKILKTCKRELALERIVLLEKTIKENYQNHEFQQEALKVVSKIRVYIENHNEDVCRSIF